LKSQRRFSHKLDFLSLSLSLSLSLPRQTLVPLLLSCYTRLCRSHKELWTPRGILFRFEVEEEEEEEEEEEVEEESGGGCELRRL
jgi:hypothetical protein